ncbi:hypothetical protein [Cellulosimicrobium marinum]|uniref:hypothetical protein n=1 Tax=Cellulosimicrobium marinum TaxID=1638992 RepID=UPI001E3F68A1|nr:hypothetical protein [Cellulosimicrobium marinum]MCB7135840.1 hypothetical protein [Cellulosimicrobium marinum]
MAAAARHEGVVAAWATLLLVGASLTGCTVASRQEPGQATAAVRDALAEAGSAAATTTLTVELLDAGRLTAPVADAAIRDQVGVLEEASTALTTLVPPDDVSSAQRGAGLDAVAGVTAEVVAARAWVARTAGGDLGDAGDVAASGDEVVADLAAAADELDRVLSLAGGA